MTTDIASNYIQLAVRPAGGDNLKLRSDLSNLNLAGLLGAARFRVTLTEGGFADGSDDGGTHHRDGYTTFEPAISGSVLEAVVTGLRADANRAKGTPLVKGVAAVVLDDQRVALEKADGSVVTRLMAPTVTLASVHFALFALEKNERLVLSQPHALAVRRELLTMTPLADGDTRLLTIVKRVDAPEGPPSGWQRLPPAPVYRMFGPAGVNTLPKLRIEFHVLPDWTKGLSADTVSRIGVFEFAHGEWKQVTPCEPKVDTDHIAICTTSGGPYAFMAPLK